MLSIEWDQMPQVTAVPDSFILKHLPGAPGEYVKVMLYLLMLSHRKDLTPSVETICKNLSQTKDEVSAALRYWEQQSLLEIYLQGKEICGIKLLLSPVEKIKESHQLNRARVKALMLENPDAKTLLFVSEQYLCKPLSPVESGTLLYFLDVLKFPLDLCEYLVEYCVLKNKKSIRYISQVGLAWHKNGIRTLAEAKANTEATNYYAVLKAFGIRDRDPISAEIEYIDKWIKDYGFTLDMITYACEKAVMKKGGYEYADKILENWHESNIRTLDEVKLSEQQFRQNQTTPAKPEKQSKNAFHNFAQRDFDYEALEKQLDNQFLNSDLFNK